MGALERLFDDYGAAHRTRGNRACHAVGIPLLTLSVLGLLGRFPLPGGLDPGLLGLAGLALWVATADLRLALAFLLAAAALHALGSRLPLWALLLLQPVGWAFQLVGHAVFERRRPAFLRNLAHVLVGPVWVTAELAGGLIRSRLTRRVPPTA